MQKVSGPGIARFMTTPEACKEASEVSIDNS